MIVRTLDARIDSWIQNRTAGESRSPGFHVSTLVLGMLKDVAPKLFEKYGQKPDDNPRQAIYEMGYVWEDLLGEVLAPRLLNDSTESLISTQGEISRDGIYGTPDRVVVDDKGLIVEETKITWKWLTEEIEDPKYLYWVSQVKTYCAMLGAERARIRALFINEIRRGEFVVPRCWELDWRDSPHELEEWWTSVRRFADAHPEYHT